MAGRFVVCTYKNKNAYYEKEENLMNIVDQRFISLNYYHILYIKPRINTKRGNILNVC